MSFLSFSKVVDLFVQDFEGFSAVERWNEESTPDVNTEQEQKEGSVKSTDDPEGKSSQERIDKLSGDGEIHILEDDIRSSNFEEVNAFPESLLGKDLGKEGQFDIHGDQVQSMSVRASPINSVELIFGDNQGNILQSEGPVGNGNDVSHGEDRLEEQISLVSIRQASFSGLFSTENIQDILIKNDHVVDVDGKQSDHCELDGVVNVGLLFTASERPVNHVVSDGRTDEVETKETKSGHFACILERK